jgi:ribosome-binding protein aMBF1 (putative translation factor)
MCHKSLAQKMKSSEDTVKKYESGDSHMTSNEVYNVSQALKVSIGFLFS